MGGGGGGLVAVWHAECNSIPEVTFGTCIPKFNLTHISFIILINMSISNNNKSIDKCILKELKSCSHET